MDDKKKDKVTSVSKGGIVGSKHEKDFGRSCRDYRSLRKSPFPVSGFTVKNFSEPGLLSHDQREELHFTKALKVYVIHASLLDIQSSVERGEVTYSKMLLCLDENNTRGKLLCWLALPQGEKDPGTALKPQRGAVTRETRDMAGHLISQGPKDGGSCFGDVHCQKGC